MQDIWLVVRVPVLSEQMTEVQPKVSTEGNERTIEFFLAMRFVPKAKQVVMTAGRPSGMAATARATAILTRAIRDLDTLFWQPHFVVSHYHLHSTMI